MRSDLPFGGTDCALPMLYATRKRLPVDAFVVMTDNETWAGNIHPVEALRLVIGQQSQQVANELAVVS